MESQRHGDDLEGLSGEESTILHQLHDQQIDIRGFYFRQEPICGREVSVVQCIHSIIME